MSRTVNESRREPEINIRAQVRFALGSGTTFSRTDKVTDSEYFYELLIEVLEDPDEYVEVSDLLKWWNQ
jgi:hypothetical protein